MDILFSFQFSLFKAPIMQQTIPKYDYSRARNVIVPRSITPEKSKVTTDQELLKGYTLVSNVFEICKNKFLQTGSGANFLQSERSFFSKATHKQVIS